MYWYKMQGINTLSRILRDLPVPNPITIFMSLSAKCFKFKPILNNLLNRKSSVSHLNVLCRK